MSRTRVAISNGFGQFHLRGLAEELDAAGELVAFATGALPPQLVHSLPERLRRSGALRRLSERSVDLRGGRIYQARFAEVFYQLGQLFRRRGIIRLADYSTAISFDLFARSALAALSDREPVDVFHVRAGVGGRSIRRARARGVGVCCDHSIVAPRVIDQYVPQSPPTKLMPRMWNRIQQDIDAADVILVNSDFVKQTFVESGIAPERVSVAYTPVDPSFAAMIDAAERARADRPMITFAGTGEYRKGIDVVVRVAEMIGADRASWRVVGDWAADASVWRKQLPSFVSIEPKLPRAELAQTLAASDVFFFPSRAEGSARVVAEALRAGSQVVTTRMAGSAARHGTDGFVLPSADDLDAFVGAIEELISASASARTTSMIATKAYARERLSRSRYLADVQSAYVETIRRSSHAS